MKVGEFLRCEFFCFKFFGVFKLKFSRSRRMNLRGENVLNKFYDSHLLITEEFPFKLPLFFDHLPEQLKTVQF